MNYDPENIITTEEGIKVFPLYEAQTIQSTGYASPDEIQEHLRQFAADIKNQLPLGIEEHVDSGATFNEQYGVLTTVIVRRSDNQVWCSRIKTEETNRANRLPVTLFKWNTLKVTNDLLLDRIKKDWING